VASRVLRLALLIVMIAASALTGRSYRWCVAAQRVATTACCPGEELDDTDVPEGAAVGMSCCEERVVGQLPASGARSDHPMVPPAPVSVATSSTFQSVKREPPLLDAPRRLNDHAPVRAGPVSSAGRCALLQVFHC